MSILESLIAEQARGPSQAAVPPYTSFLVIALLILVMTLVVLVFIRTSGRGSSRR